MPSIDIRIAQGLAEGRKRALLAAVSAAVDEVAIGVDFQNGARA